MPRTTPHRTHHFRAALRASERARQGISKRTYERRLYGPDSAFVRWLLRNPELIDALAADARAHTEAAPIDEAA